MGILIFAYGLKIAREVMKSRIWRSSQMLPPHPIRVNLRNLQLIFQLFNASRNTDSGHFEDEDEDDS